MPEFIVDHDQAGKRLDVFISSVSEVSRSQAKLMVENGDVSVNGRVIEKPSYRLREGDTVSFEIPEPVPVSLEPENIPLDIVYEDDYVIVINKPPGMVVHPAPGHYRGTLVNALLYHCRDLGGISGNLRPGIVHRLDKDTAGLLVVAKNDLANSSLVEQFKRREVVRLYRALVYGIVEKDRGRIVIPIGRDRFDRKKFSPRTTSPREAITNYRVVKRYEKFNVTDIRCKLETGRTHQIRVHMSYIGHPILGDYVYGFRLSRIKAPLLRKAIENMGMHALCAFYLSFRHPKTGKVMEFEVDLPEGMKRVIDVLEGRV